MTRVFSYIIFCFCVLYCILYSFNIQAQNFSFYKIGDAEHKKYPKHEVRAVWITTIGGLDWPRNYAQSNTSIAKQQQELISTLDQLEKAGINTILLQTRVRGTVIYPSEYEPWDGCLSGVPGKSPGYDALQFAIEECHKRGMEIHAWIVTIPVGKWNGLGVKHLRNKYPYLIKKIGDEGYMNPENNQTATYLANLCEEITKKYDIDGIHLDYIRYPETWNLKVMGHVGRQNITSIVEAIHAKVKHLKPWVKMSCSPIGKFDDLSRYHSRGWNAYSKVYQDAQGWLKSGIMDALFPMMYFQGNNFYPFAIDWSEQSNNKIIVPGLGIYFLSPKEKNWELEVISREMQMLRQYGMGYAFFRSKFFIDDTKGIYQFTKQKFNQFPSLIPPMSWESNRPPLPPSTLSIKKNNSATIMSWHGAKDNSDAPYLLYNVYSSKDFPVNINDPRNLIAIRRKESQIVIPRKYENRFYAITAIDRYGNESEALQSKEKNELNNLTMMLPCDNNHVIIPENFLSQDMQLITIESIVGNTLTSRTLKDHKISIKDLPNGTYSIRSINKKGIGHRIGYFIIQRK